MKLYTVTVEYKYRFEKDITSNWARETFNVVASTAKNATDAAIIKSQKEESREMKGKTIHRLVSITEGATVDVVGK